MSMNVMQHSVLALSAALLIGALAEAFGQAAGTNEVMDFSGVAVALPARVERIACIHPIFTYMSWRIAPDKIVSVDKIFSAQYLSEGGLKVFNEADLKFLKSLPVTGVFFSGVDSEQILGLRPDALVTITNDANIDKLRKQLGIPIVVVSKSRIQDYEESFRILGKVLGRSDEAGKLADYWHGVIASYERKAKDSRPPRVLHIATGGITSVIGGQTIMGSIVELAGGANVSADLPGDARQETISVSLEQILAWDPEVIVTQNEAQRTTILSDPAWREVSAVKAKRVYAQLKYAKVDGLTSLMSLKWYDFILHHPEDKAALGALHADMKDFYRVFYRYEIGDAQLVEPQQ